MSNIQVAIIDDSMVIRQTIVGIINMVPDMEVIYVAENVAVAREKLTENWPDVILLDIEMPGIDGMTFLSEIMQQRPTSVIICSALIEEGPKATMNAIGLGAVGIISKPTVSAKEPLTASARALIASIRAAAKADMSVLRKVLSNEFLAQQRRILQIDTGQSIVEGNALQQNKLVVLGSAIGGTQALEWILPEIHRDTCCIIVVQRMQEQFIKALVKRLDSLCEMQVKRAEHGDVIRKGIIYFAGAEKHLLLQDQDSEWYLHCKNGPRINQQRPSIDALMESVAFVAGAQAMGGLLTGEGIDGVTGLGYMCAAGAMTFVQAQETCVVDEMPAIALQRGGALSTIPIQDIPRQIMRYSEAHSIS